MSKEEVIPPSIELIVVEAKADGRTWVTVFDDVEQAKAKVLEAAGIEFMVTSWEL